MINTATDIHKEEVQAEIKRIREKFPQKFVVKEISSSGDEDSFSPNIRVKNNIYISDLIRDMQLDTVYRNEKDHIDTIQYLQGIEDLYTLKCYYNGYFDHGPDGMSELFEEEEYKEIIQQKLNEIRNQLNKRHKQQKHSMLEKL
jgi:hypothetical protein